jgi:hypothetical protein
LTAPASLEERQLLEVLLAEPALVGQARASLSPEEMSHPGLRRLLAGLYALDEAGLPATLDGMRGDLDGSPLLNKAFELQANGERQPAAARGGVRRSAELFPVAAGTTDQRPAARTTSRRQK